VDARHNAAWEKRPTPSRWIVGFGCGVAALNACADESSLRSDVTMPAETNRPAIVFKGDSLKRSADYIVRRFEAAGCVVKRLGYR